MIATLRGRAIAHEEEAITIEVGGVGYEVLCSMQTRDIALTSGEKTFFIYTHVREDALSLFGFSSLVEKKLFMSLIKVNGIGPKLAITILSASSVDHILEMIENEDAKGLAKLPRIGKKTAEQIVLSLKGKLVRAEETTTTPGSQGVKKEVISALVNLGFRLSDVESVVEQMGSDIDLNSGVRQGLTALTS